MLNVFASVVFVLWQADPQRLQLVVDGAVLRCRLSLTLFLPLTGPPHTHHDTEDPQHTEHHAQHWHQVVHRLGHDLRLHFDLHHGQHDSAVVAFGQGTDDGTGSLLDLTTVSILLLTILIIRHGNLHGVTVGVGQVTENEERAILSQGLGDGKVPQLRADVLHSGALWNFVSVKDECDAGTAVVQVTTVGFTLGVEGRRGVGGGTHAPLVAGLGEAGEELVFHTFLSSRTRGTTVWTGTTSLQQAGPSATPYLRTAHNAVDTLAGITLLLPSTAVRELQAGVTTGLPDPYELLAVRPSPAQGTHTEEAVDLIHTGRTIGTGR